MHSAAAYSSRSSAILHIAYREGTTLIASYGNVFIAASAGERPLGGLQASLKLHQELRDKYPDGFAKLVLTADGARMPSPEQRAQVNRLVADFAPHTLACALVFAGDGLWHSSMRVVARTMMLATKCEFPQSIFAKVGDAAPWLSRQCGSAAYFEADALVQTIEQLG